MMQISLRRNGRSDGNATIEFAIIAPVLIMAVLSIAEIGFAIHESFEIDQAIRNGAESALDDPGEDRVCAVLEAVDASGGQCRTAAGGQCRTAWCVDRICACPENPGEAKQCSTTCNNSHPTAIYYEIRGVRAYSGILLPPRDLTRSASVQVR